MASAPHHEAQYVLSQLLIDAGLGTDGATGAAAVWPVFVGNIPAAPDRVIVVAGTAPMLGNRDSFGEEDEAHGVQVYVRGPTEAIAARKARLLIDHLARQVDDEPVTVTDGGTDYDYCVHETTRASGPFGVGKEPGSRRNELTLNYLVRMTPLY